MEPYTILLIICTLVSPLLGRDHSGPVQTIDFPQDKPTYSGNRGDDLSITDSQSQDNQDDQSRKCYTYEGYLNNMLPMDYIDDPVNDLKRAILSTDLESVPDEKYYLTVIKTKDAYQQGLIKSPRIIYWTSHKEGIKTQLYLLSPGFFEDRLISHSDISRAREYFKNKIERECGTPLEHKVHGSDQESKDVGKVVQGGEKKCLNHEQIRDLKKQTKKIDVNSHPGATYYKLVLKTNRAVHCNQLTVIKGTLNTGASGVKMELYIVEEGQIRMILPSTRDRRQARAFFKEQKDITKGNYNTEPSYSSRIDNDHKSKNQALAAREERNQEHKIKEPSYSSSYEGQPNNNRKLVATTAGASLLTHKTGQYSSDESTHPHERSRLIASSVVVPSSVDRGRHRSKGQIVQPTLITHVPPPSTSSSQAPMLVDYQPLQGSDIRPQMVVNTGNPVLIAKKGGSVIEEDVKVRVNVEAEVSIRSKIVS